MMPHVMLDLETFGVAPNAAIIQIGAVEFELDGPMIEVGPIISPNANTFEATISLQSSIMAGGTTNPETIKWWKERPANTKMLVSTGAYPLQLVLKSFFEWFDRLKSTQAIVPVYLWANGANFDPPILESAYRSLDMQIPWVYNCVRDTRTLWHLADTLEWVRPVHRVSHVAIDDAIAQANDVISAWRAIKELVHVKEGGS